MKMSNPTATELKMGIGLKLTYVKLKPEAEVPFLAYNESAAYDLSAHLISDNGRSNNAIVSPRLTRKIGTGLALIPPPGHLILICSRSGMAKGSVFVTNSPGVVDPTFTGEIEILLYNGGVQSFHVKHGDRIAQALVVPFARVSLFEATSLPNTARGAQGFGSTGFETPVPSVRPTSEPT